MLEQKGTILLVEDDSDDQLFFLDSLKELKSGFVCDIAKNGIEALDYVLSGNPVDIIFLDLNMPMMNGWDCLMNLKQHEVSKHIPVVIFTTTSDPHTINQMRTLGANAFFQKPTDYQAMLSKLNTLVNRDYGNHEDEHPFQY